MIATAAATASWRTMIMSLVANGTSAASIATAAPVAAAAVWRSPTRSAASGSPLARNSLAGAGQQLHLVDDRHAEDRRERRDDRHRVDVAEARRAAGCRR